MIVFTWMCCQPAAASEQEDNKPIATPASTTVPPAKAESGSDKPLTSPPPTQSEVAVGDDPMEPAPADEDDAPQPPQVEDVLRFAREGLQRIEDEMKDYSCTLVRRERINGEWPKYYQRLEAKVRHEQRVNDEVVEPFALFIEFRNPRRMQGRQVIYVEDKWHGDLVARRGGLRTPNMTVQLDPQSPLAMDGNRYSVTEFGIQKLAAKLIRFMENDLDQEDCEVKVFKNAKLEGRPCTHFQVREKTRRPDSRFRMARVLVDNEYKVPVYYAAFGWGATEEDDPLPLEEYAYINLKVNIGLTEFDFDIENPDYQFQTLEQEQDSK
jgi:hypothetical protein